MNEIDNSSVTIWSGFDHLGTSIFEHSNGFRVIIDPLKHGFKNIMDVIKTSSFLKYHPKSVSTETNEVFFEEKSEAINFYLSWR